MEAANCTDNIVVEDYIETYTATARSGSNFDRWFNQCSQDLSNQCSFNVPAETVKKFWGETAPPLVAKFREETSGFESLFMGHSFFKPFANAMSFHASNSGFTAHNQTVVFSGGATGAPEALWDNAAKRAEIQAVLDNGDIELFGMTYHPDYPGVRGYKLWIDYALAQNSNTKFFLALPWGTNPGSYDPIEYHEGWKASHTGEIHGLIDLARSQYPDIEFYCIPYGQASGELYTRLANDELLDDLTLVGSNGTGIFRDNFGHADEILEELGTLVWLYSIYGVRPTAYDYDPDYLTDLNAIAEQIVSEHDPVYDAR